MHTDELIRQLRAPDQRGVGRVENIVTGVDNIDRLSALDAVAQTIRVFDSTIIPGNLQTPDYSAEVIQAAHPHMGQMEVYRRVLLKERRAHVFLRRTFDENLVAARFVIGERAITQCLRDVDETHALQLRHILTLSAHDKIVVQVLPDHIVTPGLADQFAVYTLDEERRVGYVETIMGSWYSTRLEDMARLHSTFSNIAGAAMSPSSTRTFIREALMSWRSAKKESAELTGEETSSSARTHEQATTALESPERARPSWRSEP